MATWPIVSRDVAGIPVRCIFTAACPWLSPELDRWATSNTHHVISQPRPSPFLRRYSLPRKSKRACNGEGLGPRLSFPILDGLFVYVCMCEWEGLELLLSGRMVWPQTQPLHCYYGGRIVIGGPVEDFSPL